jgi:hypothetical protein
MGNFLPTNHRLGKTAQFKCSNIVGFSSVLFYLILIFRPLILGQTIIQRPAFCMNCFVLKPDRVRHCRRCGRCIARMDHHCPAIGK